MSHDSYFAEDGDDKTWHEENSTTTKFTIGAMYVVVCECTVSAKFEENYCVVKGVT